MNPSISTIGAGEAMKKRICIVAALFFLSQCLLLSFSPAEASAETRITVTIAAGGVACGLLFFLRFGFRSSFLQSGQDSTALLNGDPAGWEISYPSINITQTKESKTPFPDRLRETVQMELLKLRF